MVVNHDLIADKFSNGGDLWPKELNKAGGKHQNKTQHNQRTNEE